MSLVIRLEGYSAVDLVDVFLQLFILKQKKVYNCQTQLYALVKKVIEYIEDLKVLRYEPDEYILLPQIKSYFKDSVHSKQLFKNTDHIKTFMKFFSGMSSTTKTHFILETFDEERFNELTDSFKYIIKINRRLYKFPKFCEILSMTQNAKTLKDYNDGFTLFFKNQLVNVGRKMLYTVNICVEVCNEITNLKNFTLIKLYMIKVKNLKDYETEILFINRMFKQKLPEGLNIIKIFRVTINYIYC